MEYDYMSVKAKSVRLGLENDGPLYDAGVDCSIDPDTGEELVSMTKQQFLDECDINTIMRRYEATGAFPDHVNQRAGRGVYGDFSVVTDYQTALNIVMEAEDMFADLPARLRDRFENDPDKLLAFVHDENNREEAIKLGLIPEPPAPSQESSGGPKPPQPPEPPKADPPKE